MDDRRRPHCRRNPREWLAVDGSKSLCGVEEEGEKKTRKKNVMLDTDGQGMLQKEVRTGGIRCHDRTMMNRQASEAQRWTIIMCRLGK
jgi:hypothetical protein